MVLSGGFPGSVCSLGVELSLSEPGMQVTGGGPGACLAPTSPVHCPCQPQLWRAAGGRQNGGHCPEIPSVIHGIPAPASALEDSNALCF